MLQINFAFPGEDVVNDIESIKYWLLNTLPLEDDPIENFAVYNLKRRYNPDIKKSDVK